MVGLHHLEIANKRVKYIFDIERKVTVIKGNSGTGKTTLIRMLQGYLAQGNKSGISFRNPTGIDIAVFDNSTRWEIELNESTGKIIFIDEAIDYIYSKAFQEEFVKSAHYLVVISRSGRFNHLPYAINSIYGLKTEAIADRTKLTKMYQLYEYTSQSEQPDTVITEDSNSGAEMMMEIFDCQVSSAHGNGNVANLLSAHLNDSERIFTVVDGAAFGGFIAQVMNLAAINDHIEIFAPESFEYLLLNTDAYKRKLTDQLENTWQYSDTSEYLTWEQYYTDLLQSICEKEYGFIYHKNHLHNSFKNIECTKQVKETLFQNCVKTSE